MNYPYWLLLIGSPLLLFAIISVVYLAFFRAGVRWWFGEIDSFRRDREAIRRRRRFENLCLLAMKLLYLSWLAGVAQGVVEGRVPDLERVLLVFRCALFLGAILVGWCAFVRLKSPHENP